MEGSKICRLCLKKSPACSSLFAGNYDRILEELTGIQISAEERKGVPTVACMKCLLNIKLAHSICQNILKANRKLLEECLKTEEEEHPSGELGSEIAVYHESICLICDGLVSDTSMNAHLTSHFAMTRNCSACDSVFEDFETYKLHLVQCNSLYNCSDCQVSFKYKPLFDLHMENVHPFDTTASAVAEAVVEGEKPATAPFKYKCPDCIYSFDTEWKMLTHPHVGNRWRSVYTCFCGRQTGDLNKFRAHYENHNKVECSICKTKVARSALKPHIRDTHNSKPHMCEICGRVQKNAHTLWAHKFYYHHEMRWKCEECGQMFRKSSLLQKHVNRVHKGITTSAICHICGKTLSNECQVKIHIKKKHQKVLEDMCNVCGKAFYSRHSLKAHMRQHTDERPYKCGDCGEAFRQNVSLKTHRKSKHGFVEEETVHCKVCGRGFASQMALIGHSRKH